MIAFNGPLFDLGAIVITSGARDLLHSIGIEPQCLLDRHQKGDFGDMDAEDKSLNSEAIKDGSRVFSAYRLPDGNRCWVITEAADEHGVRPLSTVLLPEEY